MTPLKIVPENKEHWLKLRHNNINSTEVSSLYGCNPYQTEFELYHIKRSEDLHIIEENDAMKWGSRLQDAIAYGVAFDNGWKSIRPMKEYIYFNDVRLGSSFDFEVNGNEILEIKNVSERVYAKSWTDEEAPPHIELQVQTQMLVSGHRKTYICALVGGNSVKIIERNYMPAVGESIFKKVKAFWARTTEPQIDFERDAEFIKMLHQETTKDKTIADDGRFLELATRYNKLQSDKSLAENQMKAIQAEIFMLAGDAEKVKHEKFSLSLGQVKESFVEAHTRPARRNFRLTMRGADEKGQ